MLRAIPRSLFSWDFSIREDDVEVAGLEVAWMSERGRLVLADGTECNLYRQGWLSGLFLLEGKGTILAQAEKPSAFVRHFEVEYDHRKLLLTAQSPFTRVFGVYNGDGEIGSIYPDHWLTRRTTIDLPDTIVLPMKVFMFWLIVLMWRRAAKSSNS
jgi:hypothetical protein